MLEIPILHRVQEPAPGSVGPYRDYTHSPEWLDRYLSARREWVRASGGDLPSDLPPSGARGFLVTFDDGYRSVLERALPVLERHEACCVVFVTTAFCTGSAYPYELELASVVSEMAEVRLPDKYGPGVTPLPSRERREEVYRRLRLPLKGEGHETRESFLEALAVLNGYDRSRHQTESFLDPDEVARLSRHPLVTIGAHGHRHVLLSRVNPWTAWREIAGSRDRLEEIVGGGVDLFSYPYGGNSIVTRALVQSSGFQAAFVASGGPVKGRELPGRYRIPRRDLSEFDVGPPRRRESRQNR